MQKSSSADVPAGGDSVEELRQRHRELDQQLAVLDRRLSLTAAEQIERVRLKKEKLLIKDRLLNHSAPAAASAAR